MLHVSLFGYVEVQVSDRTLQQPPSRSLVSLLAYLVLNRDRTHLRETLAELFWSDVSREHSRKCLNTTLWRLRRMLEQVGLPAQDLLRSTPDGGIFLDCQYPHWFDVEIFEQQMTNVLHTPVESASDEQIIQLESAATLYKGDLLEGFYSNWVLRERERLRQLYLTGLAYLMRYFKAQGQVETSIEYGQQILAIDPLREDIHRTLMQLYASEGQRGQVIQQYERCRKFLADEMGIEPMEETRGLFFLLVNGESTALPQAKTAHGPAANGLKQELSRLRSAIAHLTQVQAGLQQTLDELEKTRPAPGQQP